MEDSLCIKCLLETERVINEGSFNNESEGNRIWYGTYSIETENLKRILRKYNPKEIIEIGSGSGRVIKTVLDVLPDVKLIGVETDKNMFSFIKDRFFQDKRVEINHADIADYLSGDKQYDMALCLMNTFGNINDIKVFKKIVDHADYFVFSLYNRDFDEQRKLMYKARGHSYFDIKNGKCVFKDKWIEGLVSRSYTEKEIRDMVSESDSELIELKSIDLLYFVVVKKN